MTWGAQRYTEFTHGTHRAIRQVLPAIALAGRGCDVRSLFHGVICPLFFIETLADLEKAVRQGRIPEQEVGIIADKTPEMDGLPNLHHSGLTIHSLLGREVNMDGRVLVAGGKRVGVDGKRGLMSPLRSGSGIVI